MPVPVVTGPLEGARATGARPDALMWLEGIAPRRGQSRARAHTEPGTGRHLYRLTAGELWYAGMTDAKCEGCGVDHALYDRAGRRESCALCGGALVTG